MKNKVLLLSIVGIILAVILVLGIFLLNGMPSQEAVAGSCQSEGQSCGYKADSSPFCCSNLECRYFQCIDADKIICGDDICQYPETMSTCPQDCGNPPVCGDGKCEIGETKGATYECLKDCKTECSSCFTWGWSKFFKAEDQQCSPATVWQYDNWLGKLFGIKITQNEWCPVFLIMIGSGVLVVLLIVFMILFMIYQKRRSKNGKK